MELFFLLLSWRNIDFLNLITMLDADSVDSLMNDTHELGGSTVVVDRATPKAIQNSSFFVISNMIHILWTSEHGYPW